MNKRLSLEQKSEAIYSLLMKTGRSMSAFEIGRELGYSTGTPMRKALDWMVDTERAITERRDHRLGTASYYRINPVYAYHMTHDTKWANS